MIRIIIVEDYQLIRGGIKSNILKEEDMELLAEVETGDEAYKRALELKPDIVLMDIKLGDDEYAGIKAAKKIKSELKDTRVLILTFYDDQDHITQAVEARVDGYLLKDVEQSELIKAIRTIVQGKSVIHPAIATKMMHQMADKGETNQKKREILQNLSSRELEVYELLTKGFSNKEISGKLFISEATVKAHISSILRKLDLTARTQAVITALRLKLFE
ncbi:MAG: response regulator transcription factor [Firmicutes bacterium]|nr:response regulator transcription factor [Bacillota bacterium]